MQRVFAQWISSLCCLAFLSCASPSGDGRGREQGQDSLRFPELSLPIHLMAPQEQARYLVEHYWDDVDLNRPFSDEEVEDLERKLADYIGLIQSLSAMDYTEQLLVPLKRSSEATLIPILSAYKTHLYEAGSLLASDEYYAHILQWCISSPKLTKELQTQAQGLLERVLLNRVGQEANDFVYTKIDGSKHRLLNEIAPYTLLVFATADCPSCHGLLRQISESKQLRQGVDTGDLGVLVVYVQTTQQDYKEEQAMLPDWMSSGYDASGDILDRPLYDIKASPTIYIISRSGKVVAKDVAPEYLSSWSVKSINNND